MMEELILIKFLHVLFGSAFLGWIIVSFIFISRAKNTSSSQMLNTALLGLVICDVILLLIILLQFITGTVLVPMEHRLFSTPWIQAAYLFLGCIFIILLVLFTMKSCNWYQIKFKKSVSYFRWPYVYYLGNSFIILFLIAIIHDAVTKTTLF